jgi:hypothetical protein
MSKMKISSRRWNLIAIFGSIALIVIGFAGLFLLQAAKSSASLTMWFIVLLGLVTFVFFAGPGIVFVARKRIPFVKKHIPGGTLAWVRAHLYLPILALVAAWVHASSAPFRATFSSGKVLLVVGIVISIAGVARHHLIGVTKSAINADAQISKIAAAQPRAFRQLVVDYKQLRRPLADIEADAARLPADQAAAWAKVIETQQKIEHDFPRGGSQSRSVRAYKLLRATHAPLTVVLFLILGVHVVDVVGVSQRALASEQASLSDVGNCAGCHSSIVDDWGRSSMAHAQTGTIMEAQLPVTLAKNEELARQLGDDQEDLFESAAQVCVNCHAPIGAEFVEDPTAVLPLNEGTEDRGPAVEGGGRAVNKDGVSCMVCHTQSEAFGELAGAGVINFESGTKDNYGTVFGPLFDDPNPLPVRVHDIGTSDDDDFWNDPISTSIACGACHNVKLDIDGDGLSPGFEPGDDGDDDGDFVLNENELDKPDGVALDDLVLQTTFDEWQDYVAFYDDTIGLSDPEVRDPLGCVDCHMPSNPDGAEEPAVDSAPGVLPVPNRPHRSHSFIGVDYDLDLEAYTSLGLPASAVNEVIAERKALIGSAVLLRVDDPIDTGAGTQLVDVVVTNNLLGHVFPTGFAFARQFWLEVSATTSSGQQACLVNPFAAAGAQIPCGSGEIDERDEILPQCDPVSVAEALGVGLQEVFNDNIDFTAARRVGDCDPWLANFQKILTDGDPDGDGIFTEVAYQSFLKDIVKTRQRTIDGLGMRQLEATRLIEVDGVLQNGTALAIPYEFVVPPGESITVTATMRFRHLPPEFITSLADEQEQLDNVTDSARILDADELIGNLVVSDVVTAESGEGDVLACEGPQNERGATILDCLELPVGDDAVDTASAVPVPGVPGRQIPSAVIVGGFAVAGAAIAQRGRHRIDRRPLALIT